MWTEFASPANQHPKSTITQKTNKKAHKPLHTSWICPKMSRMFDNHIVISDNKMKKTFRMLTMCDLRVLRAQRIMGFFYFNYPQINEVGKSDHVVYKEWTFIIQYVLQHWLLQQLLFIYSYTNFLPLVFKILARTLISARSDSRTTTTVCLQHESSLLVM